MRNLPAAAALLLVTTISPASFADPSGVGVQDIPPGTDKISPLRKGEPAPYDGQLFDNATSLRWGNWLLQYKLRLTADVEFERKVRAADVQLWTQRYDISEQKYTTVTRDYQEKVAALSSQVMTLQLEVNNPPWYRSPWFGFTAGVVFTGACIGLGAYSLHTATK